MFELGEPHFAIDREALEKKYYALSRALHPDRFATDPSQLAEAVSRMSRLNEAYDTLKDPERTREWILRRAGALTDDSAKATATIPLELTEAWFELQDTLMDDPMHFDGALKAFEGLLAAALERSAGHIVESEKNSDLAADAPTREARLHALAKLHLELNYLRRLKQDTLRLKGSRVHGV